MTHHLYLEVDGIQRFVFAPIKLKIIRGGSALLDRFNRIDMPDAVTKRGGEVIFCGGGHCLARGLSRDNAEKVGAELARRLWRMTEGQVSLSWGVAPDQSDWKATKKALSRDREERALKAHAAAPPLPPFVALCSSCGVSSAQRLDDSSERGAKPLCRTCQRRRDQVESVYRLEPETVWQRLISHLSAHAPTKDALRRLLPDRELTQLAELGSGSRRYLAYLYCDGNGMGRWLDDSPTADVYGQRSTDVDKALHKAVGEAICAHCPPERSEGKFGAEVLMLGGDDLIMALPADRGAAFTAHVLDAFHHEMKGAVRLSAGLVFAPATTPITILQNVATSLLQSAKRLAYLEEIQPERARQRAIGYVDFQELTTSQADVERRHAVTCRPYRLDDFKTLMDRAREVKRTGVPQGRLHALVEALSGSEREAQSMTQLVIGRARVSARGDQKAALRSLLRPFDSTDEKAPVQPYVTAGAPRADLAFELYKDDHREGDQHEDAHRWSAVPDALELIDHVGREEQPA